MSLDAKIGLEAIISEMEIKEAIWSCGNDRALGPDGFSFQFIKQYWELLKKDVVEFVLEFYETGKLTRGCNASFITLVPKVDNPSFIKDYRLITLVGLQYKIIAKILALRLAKVIGEVVSPEQ